jgi:hypothetical protein
MPQVLSGKFHSLNTDNVARFFTKVKVKGGLIFSVLPGVSMVAILRIM